MAPIRTTSAEIAARFLARRKPAPYRRRAYTKSRRPASRPTAPPPSTPPRIAIDFAEPTLKAIHAALCAQIWEDNLKGNELALTIIAERMVARALGLPDDVDDPPLTDREAG